MKDLFEIPLTSATALDFAFGGTKTRATVQKLRQQLRKDLGGSHRGVSIGRLGTVQLENVALLPCLETAGRWSRAQARQLTDAYQAAGLTNLVGSSAYREAVELTGQAVRNVARESPSSTSGMVAHAVAELVQVNPVVREVTTSMHRISVEVDRHLVEFRRYPGELVRFEGPEALVVVDAGDREVLRSVNADYLKSMGIENSGDTFVQQQLQWSHDIVASIYVPAVDFPAVDGPRSSLEAELNALETSLPRRRVVTAPSVVRHKSATLFSAPLELCRCCSSSKDAAAIAKRAPKVSSRRRPHDCCRSRFRYSDLDVTKTASRPD